MRCSNAYDPDGIRERCGPRWFADEALGVLLEGSGEDALAVVEDAGGEAVVNQIPGQYPQTRFSVRRIAPPSGSLLGTTCVETEPVPFDRDTARRLYYPRVESTGVDAPVKRSAKSRQRRVSFVGNTTVECFALAMHKCKATRD